MIGTRQAFRLGTGIPGHHGYHGGPHDYGKDQQYMDTMGKLEHFIQQYDFGQKEQNQGCNTKAACTGVVHDGECSLAITPAAAQPIGYIGYTVQMQRTGQ